MNTIAETMSPERLLSELDSLGWPDDADRDVPAGQALFKRMHAAVAALIAERDALAERVKGLEELALASQVLIEEWDRNDSNKYDIMPAKDWEKAEARFRAAIKATRAEARNV